MSTTNPTQATRDEIPEDSHTESIGDLPSSTAHAELRWQQRGDFPNTPLSQAWLDGFYVGDVSRGGTTKLHPPSETILVNSGGNIVTVLNAAYTTYTDDHLVGCPECELEFQPSKADTQCPWCDGGPSGVEQ